MDRIEKNSSARITKNEVEHLAKLARIEIGDAEVESLQKDLDKILDYVDELKEVDTENLEGVAHVTGLSNIYREDEPIDKDDQLRDAMMKNLPAQDRGFLKVKNVFKRK
ncbi:MAG: Asp-tRNA(Asn)/Glu-tRNA(Gln) amidotransferase subunit GatC [bacterium]|nr:Asp-tRNA(Asn)/Glu-tRNA(Gln) amidotransferase subunit GatC [bacterium]